MSFLNPATLSPRLGIDLSALLRLRNHASGITEPNTAWAVRVAESAGADTLILSLSAGDHVHQRADVDAVIGAVTTSQLDVTLNAEMIDLVSRLRPTAVCFHHTGTDPKNPGHPVDQDGLLSLMQRAVVQLQALSIHVIVSIGLNDTPLHLLRDAGVPTVEFDCRCVTQSGPADESTALQTLDSAILGAKQLGMAVHLAHGIDYRHVEQLARLGDVAQINIGYAIVARSLAVGWQAAINEMKALLVTRYTPTRYSIDAGAFQ